MSYNISYLVGLSAAILPMNQGGLYGGVPPTLMNEQSSTKYVPVPNEAKKTGLTASRTASP